ncbi:DUF2924 domain-containing protein [Haloferula sp. A504]|uniref:DUF2924 domain-containing protein n=1 Tax=Haloferula sp. A504 TaxID=3373601 RepID=UPI0031BFA0BD|nr:DUF2924 domain-containing protein [Verrucomicrobiaceae bacterium E54]
MSAKKDAEVARQIAELAKMSVAEMQARFLEVWGEPTTNRNRTQLRRRIAWKIQEIAYGGLSQEALKRAEELADIRFLRMRVPRGFKMPDEGGGTTVTKPFTPSAPPAELLPGTVLTREYQGRTLVVMVLDKGFEFEGQRYRSLTAIAQAVTGSHWNGRKFFGLGPAKSRKP